MQKRFVLILRITLLLLILPLLAIVFSPPAKINAQCNTAIGSAIRVESGLISAIDLTNFNPLTNVNCIEGEPASIPQFSLQTYDEMRTDYFDQAKSTYNKITITGPATQNTVSDPINLLSL